VRSLTLANIHTILNTPHRTTLHTIAFHEMLIGENETITYSELQSLTLRQRGYSHEILLYTSSHGYFYIYKIIYYEYVYCYF